MCYFWKSIFFNGSCQNFSIKLRTRSFFILICFLSIHSKVWSQCVSFSDSIKCECYDESINCTGIQKDFLQIKELFLNISFYSPEGLDLLSIDIDNLEFDPNYVMNNITTKKLTLGNQLQNIPRSLFSNMISVTHLNLQHNNIEQIGNFSFSFLHNLEELSLNHNSIYYIHPNAFSVLDKLNYLSISSNNLSELNLEIIQNLPVIRSLFLDDNNIKSIDKKINTSSLIVLHLKRNSLSGSLETNTLQGLSELQYVDLSFNNFNEIKSYALSQQNNLKVLNVSNNVIQILQEHAFGALFNLTVLDLSHNQITVVKITAFLKLKNLETLNLSANQLSAIPCEYTIDLISLKKVLLSSNKITSITPGSFLTSPGLTEIDLEGNTLECNCELASFASYIKNLTHKLENAEDIICNQPSSSASVSLVNFDFDSCPVLDFCHNISLSVENESEDEYDDYEEDELTVSFTKPESTTVPTNMSKVNVSNFSDDTPENGTLDFSESSFLYSTTESIVQNITTDTKTFFSTKETSFSTNSMIPTYSMVPTTKFTVSVIVLNFSIETSESCFNWTVNETLPSDSLCVLKYLTAKGKKSKRVSCPKFAYDHKEICVSDGDIPSFCISISVDRKFFKSCANNSESITENAVYSQNTPIVTTIVEHTSEYSEEINTYSVSLMPSDNVTEQNLPEVKMHMPLDSDIAHKLFNITKFVVTFNSSIIYVQWNVSRNESDSSCKLLLTIQSEQGVSKEKFSCFSNSYMILNKSGQERFEVCLQSFYKLNGSIMCKNILVSKAEAEASKSKDYGYQNSALIPIICLFAIVMFVVILIVIRNIYKRQLISKRYDVREKEKNIQKKISTSLIEQSVRYSYIANKHA